MRKAWQYSFKSDNERSEARRTAHDRASERDSDTAEEAGGDRDCTRAEWCASAKRERQDDGTMLRTPAKTFQAFCPADRGIIESVVREIPHTYVRLSLALRQHYTAETSIRVPFGPSVPLNVTADELMRLLVDAVCSWHERVAAVARLSGPDTSDWHERSLGPLAGRLLASSVPVLAAHLDALLALAPEPMVRPACSPVTRSATVTGKSCDTVMAECGGTDAGLEFLRLDYLARSALQETRPAPVRLLGVPCRGCGRNSLMIAPPPQHAGDPEHHSLCVRCKETMDYATYRAWCKAWANYYSGRVTPAMAAMAAAS